MAAITRSVTTPLPTISLARLFAPVSIAPLVYFRVAFGALMLWEVWRYFDNDWIRRYYLDPTFHFTYFGFDWVRPLPDTGMYLLFGGLGVLVVCILIGLCYRLSAALFFIGLAYVFLLEQARYLNHFYLLVLISSILIFVPAHRAFSVDSLLRPGLRSQIAPTWSLWLLRGQIMIVYFFGGIAKLNGDWLQGEPMRMWLAGRTDFPIIGAYFTEECMVYLFAYGGMLFDLLFPLLVLWRPTRLPVLAVNIVFHVTNAHLFSIGVFPWMMIAANVLFLPPEWLRLPHVGAVREPPDQNVKSRSRHLIITGLAVYLLVQILLPLRHLLYPGDVHWTEEGHRFSWRMKLRDKEGHARFYLTDPQTGAIWEADRWCTLTDWQFDEMIGRPDMILQFAHYLAEDARSQGYEDVEVRAWTLVSLNGRIPQTLIDHTIDLATQPRTLLPVSWITTLEQPLNPDE